MMRGAITTDELIAALVQIWSEKLGTRASGDSDFLALGGNSITAVSIAGAIADLYGVDGLELASLQAIYAQRSLCGMARELSEFIAQREAPAGQA